MTAFGTQARNACIFAEKIQNHPNSRFVSLVLIETCYIAGRQPGRCREDHLECWPRVQLSGPLTLGTSVLMLG